MKKAVNFADKKSVEELLEKLRVKDSPDESKKDDTKRGPGTTLTGEVAKLPPSTT